MKKILGIDYGNKKIGLALGRGDIVQPFGVLENRPGHIMEEKALAQIVEAVWEEGIEIVVIGLPLLKGEETKMARTVKGFGKRLQELLPENVDIKYVDESRSSKDATERAVKSGISQKRRKNDHALAACEIVRRY